MDNVCDFENLKALLELYHRLLKLVVAPLLSWLMNICLIIHLSCQRVC